MSISILGLAAAAAAICSRSPGVSEWAGRFLTELRSFFSAVLAVSTGVKVRLRVVIGVRALTICSSVSGSAAEAGPRPAKNTAKIATGKTAEHLDILGVSVISSLRPISLSSAVRAQEQIDMPGTGVAVTPSDPFRPELY